MREGKADELEALGISFSGYVLRGPPSVPDAGPASGLDVICRRWIVAAALRY